MKKWFLIPILFLTQAALARTANQVYCMPGSGNIAGWCTLTSAYIPALSSLSGNISNSQLPSTETWPSSGTVQAITPNQYGLLASGSGATASVIAPDSSTSKVLVSGGASANPGWSLLSNSNLSGSAGITNANLASMADGTVKCNLSGGASTPSDCSTTGTGSTVVRSASPTFSGTVTAPTVAGTNLYVGSADSNNTIINEDTSKSSISSAFRANTSFVAFSETSASNSNQLAGYYSSPRFAAANTQNWTNSTYGMAGYHADVRALSSSTGTVTNGVGYYGKLTNSGSMTWTNFYGVLIDSPTNAGTITSHAGLAVNNVTNATNRTGLLLNTTTIPSGTYALYSSGTNASYFGGAVTVIGNATNSAAVATPGYDTSTATGGTITASANTSGLMINSAGGTTLTIKLPSSPIDGQIYWVASAGAFTSVTWQDAGGTAANVIGGQSAIGGTNRGQTFVYRASTTTWYAIS